jgi:hypothetical protein
MAARSAPLFPATLRSASVGRVAVLPQRVVLSAALLLQMLREYANPICLFGEGPGERRDRLRDLIASLGDRAAIRKRPLTEDVGGEAQVRPALSSFFLEGGCPTASFLC